MRTSRSYTQSYRNLCENYNSIQSKITKIRFQDPSLEELRKQIVTLNLPENPDILGNLKNIQKAIKPKVDKFDERMQIFKEDFYGDKPLSTEVANAAALHLMLCRFKADLKKIIQDIKLECLMDDKDEILFKIIDTANIEDNTTLLLEATSQPLPPKKIIKKLLDAGADPFIQCGFNDTPFSQAVGENNVELAKLYLDYKIHRLEEDNITLNSLQRLLEAPNGKIFYEELAKALQDTAITDTLGLDPGAISTCSVYVGLSYEALGYDSSILGNNIDL